MPDLVGHDRQHSAFLVYLFLWARTLCAGRAEAALSVAIERSGPTEIIVYSVLRPWSRRAARP